MEKGDSVSILSGLLDRFANIWKTYTKMRSDGAYVHDEMVRLATLNMEFNEVIALIEHLRTLNKANNDLSKTQDKHISYIKYLEHCLKVLEGHFLIRLIRRFGCLRIKPYKSSLVD